MKILILPEYNNWIYPAIFFFTILYHARKERGHVCALEVSIIPMFLDYILELIRRVAYL